ncbi:alpha-amylase family protein [Georgenia yuyongxinii]|uniref:Trehalose synthase n=1 Tax=Georgenia yuyongxinii TaxID=2589797 RepID=A0A552WWJ8_9MICO|nr:alpha-amylase family protein [Georgenia yuyongxinii]TRW46969.1 trehalose synthase [Georgenia yuyongxinii]
MRMTETSDLWWKNAVIYCLDIETFFDADGDGTGDIAGLAERIDYLAELGVTCLWLMPFYPTPDRDDGYDVTDYYGVDRRLGNHGDVVELIRTANDRGMRVIADLLINHTSDQHPWFRSARASKDSPYRDFYVWRPDTPPDTSDQVVFPDKEDSIWELDEKTGEWYLHHFYSHQPDLNIANPRVRDEIMKTIGFWLELGVSGFRVDAVPFFLSDVGLQPEDKEVGDPHTYLKQMRAFLGRRRGDAILLGEVNLPHDEQQLYFGQNGGDELNMLFDFITMQNLYLALARADARPLVDALVRRPPIPPDCQWATFLRNHDELTLDKLSEEERGEVFAAFGPDPEMQVFGRGLKRRVPPMLDGDPRRVRMAYSLLFSLPGTPTLYYGEEIGMGEDLRAEGRMAVRTPMQWSDDTNAGFSTAPARKLVGRVVEGGYGPEHVNAAAQVRDPDSLWNFIRNVIQTYRSCPELGWGSLTVLDQPHHHVLAHQLTWHTSSIVAVHNFSSEPVTVPLRPAVPGATAVMDLLQDGQCDVEDGAVELTLEGYGYRWLRVMHDGERRLP